MIPNAETNWFQFRVRDGYTENLSRGESARYLSRHQRSDQGLGPGINNGLFCGTPSVSVGRNVGPKRALDMLFTGEFVDAQTALRDGLVSRVVPAAELDRETKALADRIAGQPPQQIAEGKAMFHRHMTMELDQAYALATEFMAGAIQREDAQAGIDAFVNKKPKPEWKGR